MLSINQKEEIISRVAKAFERQFGVKRAVADLDLVIDKPNKGYLCSIFVMAKSDPFRVKLNLAKMDVSFSIGALRNAQLQDYGPGMDDEIYVADLQLPKREYVAFYNYLKSPKFKAEVIDDEDIIVEDDGIAVTDESGAQLYLEDEGV